MNTLDKLRKVRAVIEQPEHWCQGNYAVSKYGTEAPPQAEDAVKWCLLGAQLRVDVDCIPALVKTLKANKCVDSIAAYNDSHTHAEVLSLLDKAIKRESVWWRFWKRL